MANLDEIMAIFGKAIFDGIWGTPGVGDQPVINLIRWRVVEVTCGRNEGDRHLVGYCPENCEGRVSTAITSFDTATMQCTTKSGRLYQLLGESGYDSDGEYVWRGWSTVNGVMDQRDVSFEFTSKL